MGLDSVEFVIALEETFGVEISDADATRMRTPRDVIEHLLQRLPTAATGPCLSQRAFCRLRRALHAHAGIARDAVSPDAELDALLPRDGRAQIWEGIRTDLSVPRLPPPPSRSNWFRKVIWLGPSQSRDTVRYVIAHAPRPLLGGEPWTRAQVTAVVSALCEEEFGVDMRRFTLDSEFVRDMAVD
jgi:hypothetical protein